MYTCYQASPTVSQLYVGDLDPSIRESDIYNHIKPYGEIATIKLVRNPVIGNKSYAFVSFKDQLIVPNLRRELNGTKIGNSTIRVSKVTKDFDPEGNIFIKNLPASANLKTLEEKFSTYGSIISSKIAYSPSGQPLGYGFIQFDFAFQAQLAIKSMNGQKWDDQILSVCEYLPISSRHFSSNTNLYIKNFPATYSQETIKSTFAVFGEIVSIGIINSTIQNSIRAFGFVCFKDSESARKACDLMHGKKENDFEWYVMPHMSKTVRKGYLREQYMKQIQEWKLRNLYIKNLHFSICENKLKDLCVEYGNVTSVKIVKNEHIKYNADGEMIREMFSKGVGFVCFEQEFMANKALKELQEKSIEGVKLFVAKWLPKSELRYRIIERISKKKQANEDVQRKFPLNSDPRNLPNTLHMKFPIKNMQVPKFALPVQPIPSKQVIGEMLFVIVKKHSNQKIAGKITGMLLEMDLNVLYKMMSNDQIIREKILEANEVLKKAWKDDPELSKYLL